MGRNSKKSKGRKPAAPEQGLKGAATLASSSANVATTPSRPARTAKHKIRKFPSQSTTAPSTQATDSHTARGLKETQPSLAPNSINQETPPLGPSTTGTCKSLRTSIPTFTESAIAVGSSKEKEIALPQPITTNLSDSYDSSSASSSETETGMQDDVGYIQQKGTMQQTQNVSILQQGDEKLKGLIAEEHISKLLVATESKEVPQRADSIEHISGIVAIPDITGPVTSLLHDKPEAKVSEILKGSASRAQAEGNTSFEEGPIKRNNSLLQVSHPIKHDDVPKVLSSCFKAETSKQTAGDDTSSDPVVGRKEDSKLLNAETDVREQSSSGSETTIIDVLVTSCTSADNLKQKKDEEQELEHSFDERLEEHEDQTSAEKNNEPANFTEEIEDTRNISAYQTLPSGEAYNSVEEPFERNDLQNDTTEETRQANLCCMEEAPPCTIQESASSSVNNQQDKKNVQRPLVDVLQQQGREISGLAISNMMIQKNAVQATDSNQTLESEQGQAPIVTEQQLHAEVEQEYEPGVLNRTTSGTIKNERRIIDQELLPLTVEKEITTSTYGTRPVSPADIIIEAEQDLQESHALEVSTSVNAANEAQGTYKENSRVSQILEHQEDVHVTLEAQTVVSEEAATSQKHNLLNSEQYIEELVESEVKVPTSECQETAAQSNICSSNEKHATNSVEIKVKKDEVAVTEVDNLELKEKRECRHEEQPDQLARGIVFEGHTTNSVRSEMEKLEYIELKVNSTLVNHEECHDKKPDQANSSSICEEHKTTDTLENEEEKPAVREPQVVSVTLGSDSVCKEHTRFSENAIEEFEVGMSEEAIVFEEGKEFEELSQPEDIRKPADKKPEVKELELKSATLQEKEVPDEMPDQVDTGYVCKEETHCVGMQLENELEVDNVALPEEKDTQENKPDQLDSGAACEGHATNTVESEMDKLQVGEPDIKDISLKKEDYLQGKPDHDQGSSVSQMHKTTDSIEEATAKLDVGEHLVGGVMLHEDYMQGKPDHDQGISLSQMHKTTDSIAEATAKLDVGEHLVGGVMLHVDQKWNEDEPDEQLDTEEPNSVGNQLEKELEVDNVALLEEKESQEHKPEHLDSDVACEGKAKNSLESEIDKIQVGEPEVKDISLDYLQGKPGHATGVSVYQEYKITDSPDSTMEKVDMGEPLEGGVTLHEDQKSKEDEPDQQLERGIEDQAKSVEIEMEKLEVRRPEVKDMMLDKDQCVQEKTGHDHCGSVCQEDKTTESLEYVMDKFDPGEPLVGGDKDQERHEEKFDQQLDGDTVCEEQATNSIESEMEKLAVPESQADLITLNNPTSQEEKTDQAHSGSVCEEHKIKAYLEKVEKLDSHMDDVTLDEDQAYQEEKPHHVDRDSVCQEQTKCSENKKEKLDVEELGVAIAIEERECQERHPIRSVEEEMEQSMPEVVGVTFEEKKDSTQRNTGQVDSGYVDEEPDMHSTENQPQIPEAGEPEVECVALHKETESQEEEFEQLKRGIVCDVQANPSVKTEMKKVEGKKREVELHNEEFQEVKCYEDDVSSVCEEQQQTRFLEDTMENPDVREDKKPKVTPDNNKQEEKHHNTNVASFCAEHQQTDFLEDSMEQPDVGESQMRVVLGKHKELREETSDQVDSDYVDEEHDMNSTENQLKNPKVGQPEVEGVALHKERESQDNEFDQLERGIICEETGMEKVEGDKPMVAPGNECQEEKHHEANMGSDCEEHQTHLLQDAMEKSDEGEVEKPKETLDNEASQKEKHHEAEVCFVSEEQQQTHFLEDAMEKPDVGKPEVTLDKAECEEEKHHEVNVGSVCEEHQRTHFLEDAMEKPGVGEPQVGVVPDKHEELQEETSDQADSDYICEEHPAKFMENEAERLEVGESEKAITIAEKKECQEEHATTKFMENEMEQPKQEVESLTLQENKESPEKMLDPTDRGCVFKEHEMQSVENKPEKPEVEKPEVEDVALQKEKEMREDELDQPTICERYAKTCVDNEPEKLEDGKPVVALDKDECKEEKHFQADDGSLCGEHQQTDLEHAMEKPVIEQVDDVTGGPQVEGVKLDKDQESLDNKPDQISKDSGCQEHPTSYSIETEIEKDVERELEKAIALEEEKEFPAEHTTKSVENETEQPKPEVEGATLDEKKKAPKEIQDQIDSVYEDEEHEMHSDENELEKPELGEAGIESAAINKRKDSQEDKPDQIKRGTVWKEDAKDSIELETEEFDIGNSDLNSTALDKDECEEEKHHQADDGSVYEDHQATDFLEKALEKPDVRALNKEEFEEEENHHQDDNGSVYEHQVTDLLENEPEKPTVGKPQVEGIIFDKEQELQEDIPDQVDSDSVPQKDQISSIKHEIEKLDMGESEKAVKIKEERDFQEEHTAKIMDNEMEEPKPEIGTAILEEEEESPEEVPDHIDHGHAHQEYQMHSMENELEKMEEGEPAVETSAVHRKKECQEQESNQLEKSSMCEEDAKKSIESETEMLEVREPDGNSTTFKEECEAREQDQADGGSVCEKDQLTNFLEHAIEKPDVKEPQMESVTLDKAQELPEEKSDQAESETLCQEHPTNSVIEVGELQTAIAVKEDTINSVEDGMQQHKQEAASTTLDEKKEGQEQLPDQVDGSYMCKEHEMPSLRNGIENPGMGEPEIESVALHKKKESPEAQLELLERGAVCEGHTENSVENKVEKPEVNNSTLDKEESKEGKNDQADGGSTCRLTDLLKHAMEKPDVEEREVEGPTLDNDQELPEEKLDQADDDQELSEEKLDQTDNSPASEGSTERVFERKTEKLQVEESEAPITLHDKKGYSGHLCQPYLFDEQSNCPAKNTKQQLELKEPAVESAPLEKREECQEETSYQIESDSVCNAQEAKSVKVSETEVPELEDITLYRKKESKEGEAKVRGSSQDEQLIRDSVEKDLKRLEEVEAQAGPTLEEKAEFQPDHADSVCEEQAVNPVPGELKLVELEKPEEEVLPDKRECQVCIPLHQENESKEGKADEVIHCSPKAQFITDSVEKGSEKLEGDDRHAAVLALKEIQDCQPDHTSSVCEEQAPESVARELKLVELEEPEAANTPEKIRSQEKEPGQVHSCSICEEEITNLMQNELEKPEMVKPKVEGVKLDEEKLGENYHQNTTSSLKGETEKLELELEEAGAAFEIVDCENEPNQLHIEPVTKEHDMISLENEMGKLEVSDPEDTVNLEGENDYQEEKPADVKEVSQAQEQITRSSESDMEKLEVEDTEVTLGENTESQDDKPGQLNTDSACEEEVGEQKVEIAALRKEREFQEENPYQVEKEPEVGDVMLDEIEGCHKDKPQQIGSHSECEQHQAVSVEHEMEALDVGEAQEGCPEKEECQGEDSGQLNSDFAHEEQVINTAETEKGKLEMGELEIHAVLLNDVKSQKEKLDRVCDSSECEQYTTRSVEDIEKLKIKNSEFEEETPGSGYEEKKTDFMENDTQKSEVGETETQVIKVEKKECQSEKTDQIMHDSLSEGYATDLEHDMDKPLISQPELGGIVALDERKERQEEVTNAIHSRSSRETEKPEEDVLTQGGGKPKQVDENRCVSEAQTVESVENEREKQEKEKPEVGVSAVEDVPDEMEHQSEAPNQPSSQSACEELATNSPEDNINKLEVDQPEAEKPVQVIDRSAIEEHASDSAKNGIENLEMRVSEMAHNILQQKEGQSAKKDQARSDSVSEEHANDTKDDMDNLEVKEPEVSMPLGIRSVGTAHSDSVENETKTQVDLPEVEVNVLDKKEYCSDKPNPSDHPSVGKENMTNSGEDHLDELEVNQSMVEKTEEVIDSTISDSEVHTLNSLKNETEKSHVRVLTVEDHVLNENPDQDESNSECATTYQEPEVGKLEMLDVEDSMLDVNPDQDDSSSEHATAYQEPEVGKLEMHQPQSHEIVKSSTYVHEAHMLNPLQNETEKSEEVAPEVEENVLDHKECLGDNPYQDESAPVHEVHATDSTEEDMDYLEVNLPEVGTLDQVISGSLSVIEAHTVDSLRTEVENNVLEKKKECIGENLDRDESSSVYEEHATDSKEDDTDKPEVNQRDVIEPDLASFTDVEEPDLASFTDAVESLGHGTEKPEEGVPGVEDNALEQKEYLDEKPDKNESSSATNSKEDEMEKPEEAVPKVEHDALEPKECFNEKPDQDAISSVFEEHKTDHIEDDIDKLDVNQPKVEEPDQVFASSTSVNETHTLDSLRNETRKPEERVLEVKANEECLGTKYKQDENSCLCEEHASYSKEDDMDKLVVNQQDIGVPHQVIDGSMSVSETHPLGSFGNETKKPEEGMLEVKDNAAALKECIDEKPEQDANSSVSHTHTVDSQDNKTEKNEERMVEVEDNVLEEKVDERSNQVESSSVCEELATSFTEDSMDKLEVNLLREPHQDNAPEKNECLQKKPPKSHQDNVLEEKECLAENQDQDESSSVFEEHYTDSKEADVDKVEETPETDQVIYCDISLSEHTLTSVENGTEEPKVGVPEVEDDRLARKIFSTSQEATSLSADDYLKPKNEEHARQPVDFAVALSLENREDNSDRLSMTQNVLQQSQHEFSTEENVQEVNLSDIPAEGKRVKEFQQAPGNGETVYEQLLTVIDQETNRVSEHDPMSLEEECKMEVKDLPGVSKREIEEIKFRETIEMSDDAPKPQEGTQEIPQQLDTAKCGEARKEPMYDLQTWADDQKVPLIQDPVLSEAKVNTAIPLENIYVSQEESTVNLTTDGREVEAKEIRTQKDKQTSQFQGVNNLPTVALAELQAQEAIPGDDEGLVLSSHSDVKEMLLDIKERKDGTQDQHSPQSVLEKQESPTGNEKSSGIQELADTQYQVDNPELFSGKDVETQDPDQINSNEVAATQYQVDNPELLSDRDVETQDTDQTNLIDKQSGQKMACKDVAALIMHEEQPNFKVENQESCTEYERNTLNALGKELVTVKDDNHPKKTKMIPEIFGDSNQNVCEATNIFEKSESRTAAEIDASMNKQLEVVKIPDGDIESKQQPIQNNPEHVSLNLQEIHTQKSPTLSDSEQTKLTGINDVKGDFQTVKEISAAHEEKRGDLHLEKTAPFHIHGKIATFETTREPAKEELVSSSDANKTQGQSVDTESLQKSFDVESSQLVHKEEENEQMGSKSEISPCMQLNQLNEMKQQHEEQTPKSLHVEAEDATEKESACNQNVLVLSVEKMKPEDRQQKQIDDTFESLLIPVTTSPTSSTSLPLPL